MAQKILKQYADSAMIGEPTLGDTFGFGATPPTDGVKGWAPNALFLDLDASGGAGLLINRGTVASANFDAFIDLAALTATLAEINSALTGITSTAAELNYLDQNLATNVLTRGAGVDTAESYVGAITRMGGLIVTQIVLDMSTLIGSATDLDIIGESAAASCHWGQITTAKSGTLIGGKVTCLEVPAGGATDIDFYSATESTGAQDALVTSLTETVLVTAGGAWTAGAAKGMTGLPAANDYIYVANGAASGGTFTAGKFLIELYGA